MNKKSLITKPYFTILLLLIFLLACSTERNIAESYLTGKYKDSIFITIKPQFIYTCYKLDSNDNINFSEEGMLKNDNNSCKFLSGFTDSAIINQLYINYIGELHHYPIIIKNTPLQSNINKRSKNFDFNLVQIQIEEYETEFLDSTFSDTAIHYFKMPITAINFNTWYEITTYTNDSTFTKKVYFSQLIYKEKIEGKFVKNKQNGTYDYKYSIKPINNAVIQWFIKHCAQKNAQFTFDFILNNFIKNNFPGNKNNTAQFHYSRNIDKLIRIGKQRLVEVSE